MVEHGLIFKFAELIRECQILKTYAKQVLDQTTVGALDQAKSDLQNIQARSSTTRSTKWQIPVDRPVRTTLSAGESQPNNRSVYKARAEFSFVWEIRPLNEGEWMGRKYCLLDGMASTVIHVRDESNECLARWTVEVGDRYSPGTHFHTQLNGFDGPPFPRKFDVPRLPAIAMSPFLAMEVAIGELFQDRWKRHASADSRDARDWRGIHSPRLQRFFAWQSQKLGNTGSPWMALKLAKPNPDMLVAGG